MQDLPKPSQVVIRQEPHSLHRGEYMTAENTAVYLDGKPLEGVVEVSFNIAKGKVSEVLIKLQATEVKVDGNTALAPEQTVKAWGADSSYKRADSIEDKLRCNKLRRIGQEIVYLYLEREYDINLCDIEFNRSFDGIVKQLVAECLSKGILNVDAVKSYMQSRMSPRVFDNLARNARHRIELDQQYDNFKRRKFGLEIIKNDKLPVEAEHSMPAPYLSEGMSERSHVFGESNIVELPKAKMTKEEIIKDIGDRFEQTLMKARKEMPFSNVARQLNHERSMTSIEDGIVSARNGAWDELYQYKSRQKGLALEEFNKWNTELILRHLVLAAQRTADGDTAGIQMNISDAIEMNKLYDLVGAFNVRVRQLHVKSVGPNNEWHEWKVEVVDNSHSYFHLHKDFVENFINEHILPKGHVLRFVDE